MLRDNPETGQAEHVRVLRSDPKGVDFMLSYPDIYEDPGIEPWKDPELWSCDKVFANLKRWKYLGCDDETSARCEADCVELKALSTYVRS